MGLKKISDGDGQKRELNQHEKSEKSKRARGQGERVRAEALHPLKPHSMYKGPVIHSFHQNVDVLLLGLTLKIRR